MKKFVFGLLVMIVGFILVMFTGSFFDNGSDGPINAGTFNNGLRLLIVTLLFLSGTITVCTLLIVETLKKK